MSPELEMQMPCEGTDVMARFTGYWNPETPHLQTNSQYPVDSYLEGGGCAGGVSLRGRPPARASDRKRTSNSNCNSPFSETWPDRLPELCSASLQGARTCQCNSKLAYTYLQCYAQGGTCYCEGVRLQQVCVCYARKMFGPKQEKRKGQVAD